LEGVEGWDEGGGVEGEEAREGGPWVGDYDFAWRREEEEKGGD